MAQDLCLGLVLVQALIALVGVSVYGMDHKQMALRSAFGLTGASDVAAYYTLGIIVGLAILGFLGIVVSCCAICSSGSDSTTSMICYNYYCWNYDPFFFQGCCAHPRQHGPSGCRECGGCVGCAPSPGMCMA